MALQTDRLLLREWRDEDLQPFSELNADPEVTKYLRGRPETPEETAGTIERIKSHWAQWGYGLWAVEHQNDHNFIGFVGLHHHRWFPDDVEIGWRLDRKYWGQGLATEGASAAMEDGLRSHQLDHLISVIHRDNAASKRVAEKLHFSIWREGDFPHPDDGSPMPIVVYRRAREF